MSVDPKAATLAGLREELARRGAGWTAVAAAPALVRGPGQGQGPGSARVPVRDLDELVDELGGWPAGALVGIAGPGRARFALAAVRGHTPSAWVDLEGAFFPPGAARAGVAVDRVLWLRPRDVGDALWAVHVLLVGGTFERVVLDLPLRAARDGRVERALLRLARDAEGSGATAVLLAAAPVRGVELALALEPRAEGLHVVWHRRRGAGRRQGDALLSDRRPADARASERRTQRAALAATAEREPAPSGTHRTLHAVPPADIGLTRTPGRSS